MAEQEQALIPRPIEASTCSLCKDNAAHNCRVEDGSTHAYKEGHIQVAAVMHRNICTKLSKVSALSGLVNCSNYS